MAAYISNLKLNNVVVSSPVRITDGRPSLTWSFDADDIAIPTIPPQGIASVHTTLQKAYEVRIGTSSLNQGTSSFVGGIVTGEVLSESQFWRYNGFVLTRGLTYYGQVRVKDEYLNYSDWTTFRFVYNSLPAAFEVAIVPAAPKVGEAISVVYGFSDDDGDAEGQSVLRWFRNGVHERWLDGRDEVPVEHVKEGDEWSAQVKPHDGYEFGTAVTSDAVLVQSSGSSTLPVENAKVLPEGPTPLDPLYAFFDYAGSDPVSVRWYVNGEHVADADDVRFFRFSLSVGDRVHFEAFTPNSGTAGHAVADDATVVAATHKVINLRVNGEQEPLDVPNQTPVARWDVISPDGAMVPGVARISIGTASGLADVLDEVLAIPENRFPVPHNLLRYGGDYWLSVRVGSDADSLGPTSEVHFRVSGSMWESYVSNATGWTVEGHVEVVTDYQGFRFADGTKFAEVRLYPTSVQVVSRTILSASATLKDGLHAVTVVGQDDSIRVYVDQTLALEAVLDQPTNEKYVEFGALKGDSVGHWAGFSYTVDGPVIPGTPEYETIQSREVLELAQHDITDVNRWGQNVLLSTQASDETAEMFLYKPFMSATLKSTVSRTYTPVNRIVQSPNGQFVYFAHANGATWLKSRPIVRYDQLLNLTRRQPEDYGWTLFTSSNESTTVTGSGLVIDTTVDGGKWYYAQDRHGTPWFDHADNARGWVVDFTLRVDEVQDEAHPVDHGQPEGAGFYVNDGVYNETVNFFKNEVTFGSSGMVTSFDTTVVTEYRLLGKGNNLELWARPDDGPYQLLLKGVMTRHGSPEGNAGRPHVCADSEGTLHAVWHDDGQSGGRQLMYSRLINGGWTIPQVVVPREFNAANPRIVSSNDKLYVVFEQHIAEYVSVGYVVKNQWGWGSPSAILDGGHECRNPQIAVNAAGTLFLVWEDTRTGNPSIRMMSRDAATAAWTDLGQVNTSGQPSSRPALDATGSYVAVSWTQRVNENRTSVYARVYNSGTSTWTTPKDVSSSDSRDADFSDVLLQGSLVHVAWHDNRQNEYHVFTNRLDRSTLTSVSGIVQLTSEFSNASTSSRFPRLGHHTDGTERVVIVYERSNDVDEDAGTIGIPTLTANLFASVYTVGTTTWYANNVKMQTDSRYSRRPVVAKRFTGDAHIVYEAEMVTTDAEHLPLTETFVTARDVQYDFTLASTYTVVTAHDLAISAQLPRREVRFGDFSDAYKCKYLMTRVGVYTGSGVEPYEIGLVSATTAPIKDERSYDALVNNSGDAWLATQGGLYFFLRSQNQLVAMDDGDLVGAAAVAVAIDRNGALFVASGQSVFGSDDHFTFQAAGVDASTGNISDMTFDAENRLWVASSAGVSGYAVNGLSLGTAVKILTTDNGLPSNDVRCLAADAEGRLWIGTAAGLAMYDGARVKVYSTLASGIPSDLVNGIAIRSNNVRYVATSAGVAQMVGEKFSRLSADKTLWNNNARAILFQEPNTLWVSAMSDICQVQLDDEGGDHAVLLYGISNYAPDATAYNNLRTFYAYDADPGDQVTAEVWVNGRRTDFGYVLSTDKRLVQFETPLRSSDIVQVKYRDDVLSHTSLRQNKAEIEAEGKRVSNIDRFTVITFRHKDAPSDTTLVYSQVTIDGRQYLYKHDDSPTAVNDLPFDEIVLDTTPPTGELRIVKQVDRYRLLVAIEYADDNLSGVARMALSNFPNITTDGTTPVTPVDFATTVIHTLDPVLTNISTVHSFEVHGMKGNRIVKYKLADDDDTFYVGTKSGAQILRYNSLTTKFEVVATLDPSPAASIDFMVQFNSFLVVGVGKTGGGTRVLYSKDGRNFSLVGSINAPHSCGCAAFGAFWVGGSDGNVYLWTGGDPNTEPLQFWLSSGQKTIWAIQSAGIFIVLATGDQGNLVGFSPNLIPPLIIYTDPDPNLVAIDTLTSDDAASVFVGTASRGTIMTGNVKPIGPFAVSYQQQASRISQIKIDDAAMRFSIANKMWTATANPTFSGWAPFVTFDEDVVDFAPSATTGKPSEIDVWVVTDNKVIRVQPPSDQKKIYLQLIDNAGNKSLSGHIFDSIAISDLVGFVNENRILTLDRTGRMLDFFDGQATFYSARKVERETGEYFSEVFFGTNNLIAWDLLTFDCTVPDGTDVTIYLRVGDSRDEVLTQPFEASYGSNFRTGVNITFLRGKYIQFKAVLSTTSVDATPLLNNVIIRSKTSEATHFYTTNFILGSKVKKGLLTAQTVIPVSADIIFGYNTKNSVEFTDYQQVTPDKLFVADENQIGTDIRIGVKFITPTPALFATDTFGEYGPYDTPLYVNNIEFSEGSSGRFHFRLRFYKDFDMTELVYTAFTEDGVDGWTLDGGAFPFGGLNRVNTDPLSNLTFVPVGDSPLVCNTYYYVRLESYNVVSQAFTTKSTGHTFISACNTTFIDAISFDHTASASATYQFRVRLYNDPEQTDLARVYYTGTNASLWAANTASFPSLGLVMTNGQTATITLHPPSSDMVLDKVYHLSIDAYDGTSFGTALNGLTFRVSDPTADTYCGEYRNVPVLYNMGLILTLEDGRTVIFKKLTP